MESDSLQEFHVGPYNNEMSQTIIQRNHAFTKYFRHMKNLNEFEYVT